ncbi:helix-turn-helix domain-containing protein [Bacillus sp. V5-8f]|uniref:helix-turn-helix domain-containing protein n=1 Tax=Bacillus sp. V5-8f TaxID=2053044 RepID=UPI000C76567A|nr:helix-turn-helix domain-containing protein [Bacillus sp. V5-8f]PLT31975.1 hypothetical protein CUU64_20525 [Bacillus sp. V5-8f]
MDILKQASPTLHSIFNVPDDAVLHAEDIAEMVHMHVESVRRWCRKGKLRSYNFGNKYIVVGSDFKDFTRQSKKFMCQFTIFLSCIFGSKQYGLDRTQNIHRKNAHITGHIAK